MCTSPLTYMTDLTDHSLLEEAAVLCHQLIGLMVNISSCCHYKLLSQPSKLSWTWLYKWPCGATVVILSLSYLKIIKKNGEEEIISKPNGEHIALLSTFNIPSNMSPLTGAELRGLFVLS